MQMGFRLDTGAMIPAIGFGTWKLTGEAAPQAVAHAIGCGYRLIDTAAAYGNEEGVGEGIARSGAPRGELFVEGKLWNAERTREKAIQACQTTLTNLGLKYLDLYLMHWPASPAVHENWREINLDAWRGMEQLYRDGLVRAIGVCNFRPHHLEALIERAEIAPSVNQIEYHPGLTQRETLAFCRACGILVEAWSPLGSGKMLKKENLKQYADKYGRSVAQLLIRWCLQNRVVPLPRSKTPERIEDNLRVFDFEISPEDMEALGALEDLGWSGLDPDEITLFG
jgi:diketogulonate reductase-like aldo/keto reductase